MPSFSSFVDEMVKIAELGDMPVVQRLPVDADMAMEAIKKRIDKSNHVILGSRNVAVPIKRLGDLEQYGFRKTRLAVPHPGERFGAPSWRRDDLHAHKNAEYYYMHKDKWVPKGLIQTARHIADEGIPAASQRYLRRLSDVAKE